MIGGRDGVAASVSRETLAALDTYVGLLQRWQKVQNLVAPSTLTEIWDRHVADSLQLLEHAWGASWVDLGSGAGFPGLVVAIAWREDATVELIESNGRKCAFLREVIRATGARAHVHQARIEDAIARFEAVDVVCARALAPLTKLLDWASPLLTTGSIGLFPKGREAETELTLARARWKVEADLILSRTAPDARIVRVRALAPREALASTPDRA